MSPSRTHSHQERLRDDLERTHAEISQLRDYNDYCRARGRAPHHYYRDLDILQSRYAQLSLALEESLQDSSSGHRGRSPVIVSHRVASPSDAPHPHRPDWSSLQRPRLSPRPGSSSQDRRRPRDASSGLHHHSCHSQERYQDRFAPSAEPRHSRRPRSRGSLSPKRLEFTSRVSPSPQRMGFASRESPSHSEWDSPQEGPPLQSEWDSLLAPSLVTVRGPFQGIPLLQSDGDVPQGVPSLQSEWDSLLGGPLLKNEWDSPQGALPLQSEWDSPQGASPLHSEWDSLPGGPLHQSEWDSLPGVPFTKANGIRFEGFPLSQTTTFCFEGLFFSSTAAFIPCFVS